MCKSIVHMMQDLELRRSTALTRPSTAAERPAAAVQERPATSGAECATTKPLISLPIPVDRTLPIPAGMPSVDCQPNQWAPLLRDEKSRRDWVERELDACCASYDLQVSLTATHVSASCQIRLWLSKILGAKTRTTQALS